MNRFGAFLISLCVASASFAGAQSYAQDRIWGPGDRKRAEEERKEREAQEQKDGDGVTFTTRVKIKEKVSLSADCANQVTAQKDLKAAIETCNAALEENPNDAQSYYYRGYGYYYLKDYEAAERDFTQAINLNAPRISQIYYQRGVTRERLRRFRQACVEDYRKALEYSPEWGRAKRAVESCAWAYEDE